MSNGRRIRRRLVLVGPDITEDQSPDVREGIVRRRLVVTTGVCPCGARFELPELVRSTVTYIRVEHEPDCPALIRDLA
jgi:hypothetical protein